MATWKSFVVRHRVEEAEQARQDMVVERCVRRMQQMTHVRVFDRWYEAVQEVKAMRGKVNKVLSRWKALELAGVFEAWISFVDRRVLCRRVLHMCQARCR